MVEHAYSLASATWEDPRYEVSRRLGRFIMKPMEIAFECAVTFVGN